MPTIRDVRGQDLTLYSQDQVDFFVNMWGKSPKSFVAVPQWLRELAEMPDMPNPAYAFASMLEATDKDNDGEPDLWKSRFTPPTRRVYKPGFIEIFTASKGRLTGEEVRDSFKEHGYGNVASGQVVSAYNNLLEQDHALYGDSLDHQEIREWIGAEAFARFELVHKGMALVAGADPVYFSYEADYHTDGPSVDIEGIKHVLNLEAHKGQSIGIAFPGSNCLVNDSFLDVWPVAAPLSPRKIDQPGRERWYRTTGMHVFDATMYSPILTLSRIQLLQGQQGRPITMDFSPILRAEMLRWD